MKLPKKMVRDVLGEMAGAELGDERRTRRLQRLLAKVAKNPGASLPAALGCDAEVQAAYRFMNNDETSGSTNR